MDYTSVSQNNLYLCPPTSVLSLKQKISSNKTKTKDLKKKKKKT